MNSIHLNPEEQDILDAFEAGEFISVMTPPLRKAMQSAAEQTLKKDKRINIRISSRDLLALQRLAVKEGLPYQTLVSSILHKYVSGRLEDKIVHE
jgi:predicted DNA binding CopG/RHH family protein